MATYKVIQDIEAEDKLLGPLTFRQFIYALITSGMLFLAWLVFSRGFAFMAPVFLLPALLTGFFAFPWGRDQPTEIWALAKIRFMLKPRKRIWNQGGAKSLVTVTAPKQIKHALTDNMSQTEVKSRLRSLADMIDSRGWAIKETGQPMQRAATQSTQHGASDRLVQASFQQPVATDDIPAADDMFDEQNNPRAQRLNGLIDASRKARHQKVIEQMNQPPSQQTQKAPNNYWFLNQPAPSDAPVGDATTFNTQVVMPGTNDDATPAVPPAAPNGQDEAKILEELKEHKQELPAQYYGHTKKIIPLSQQKRSPAPPASSNVDNQRSKPPAQSPPPKTASPQYQATLRQLAGNNDLNVATIAREAKRSSDDTQNEVVVKLH